jgi:hypothetical protein
MGGASVFGSTVASKMAKEKKDDAVEWGKQGTKNKAENAKGRVGQRARSMAARAQGKYWDRRGIDSTIESDRSRYADVGSEHDPSRQATAEHIRLSMDDGSDGSESTSSRIGAAAKSSAKTAAKAVAAQKARQSLGPGRSKGDD